MDDHEKVAGSIAPAADMTEISTAPGEPPALPPVAAGPLPIIIDMGGIQAALDHILGILERGEEHAPPAAIWRQAPTRRFRARVAEDADGWEFEDAETALELRVDAAFLGAGADLPPRVALRVFDMRTGQRSWALGAFVPWRSKEDEAAHAALAEARTQIAEYQAVILPLVPARVAGYGHGELLEAVQATLASRWLKDREGLFLQIEAFGKARALLAQHDYACQAADDCAKCTQLFLDVDAARQKVADALGIRIGDAMAAAIAADAPPAPA